MSSIISEDIRMRLREFVSGGTKTRAGFQNAISKTVKIFNKNGLYLSRYGGPERILQNIDDPREFVAIFGINNDVMIGFSAGTTHGAKGITRVYIWKEFYGPYSPDFSIDLPLDINMEYYSSQLINLIKSPKEGDFPVQLKESMIAEMAVRVGPAQFIAMAQEYASERNWDVSRLTMKDLNEIAQFNDVQIPLVIRRNYSPPRQSYYDLSEVLPDGETAMTPEERARRDKDNAENQAAAKNVGAEFDDKYDPRKDEEDPEVKRDLTWLQGMNKSVEVMDNLNKKGRLVVQGRRPNGHLFKISGGNIEGAIAGMKQLLDQQMKLGLDNDDDGDLKHQMNEMRRYINAIITGRAESTHSVIITGPPGSGKSYTIMDEIENTLGLKEGKDYILIQGGISTTKLFERLFVSHDKVIIFDDCDSMWNDAEAVNLLKAALQTGNGVRSISRDKANTIDTAKMTFAEREEALSDIRSFYDDPHSWAINTMIKIFPSKAAEIELLDDPAENPFDKTNSDERNDWQSYKSKFARWVQKPLETGTIKLPNKIHFEGKIIFISNLSDDDLDDAVLSRATTYPVNVTNQQVVDFVEEIMSNFKQSFVDMNKRKELLDFIKGLYTSGAATKPFSIRAFINAMDLVAMEGGDWKKRVAKTFR